MPAVDHELLARDVVGRDQIGDGADDVGRRAEAAERRAARLPLRHCVVAAIRQQHRPGRDRADADVGRERARERSRQLRERGLGGGVRREARPGLEHGDVGDEDDHAALAHRPAGGLRAEEAAGQRRAEGVGEERRIHLQRVRGHEPARGRVHEHVEAAERARRRLDGLDRGTPVGQVGCDRVAAGAGRGECRGRRLGVARGAVIGERDLRAALGKADRERAAEPARAPRHEHAGARDVHRVSRPRASAGSRG